MITLSCNIQNNHNHQQQSPGYQLIPLNIIHLQIPQISMTFRLNATDNVLSQIKC